jgi:hypothetical protein
LAYDAAFPNRVAFKHAHSQQNPEQDWGTNTLQSIVFAFYALNEQFGSGTPKRIALDRRNTLVIASGISNGGTGALAAAEQDKFGLIDGVAVTEPNAQPRSVDGLTIRQGATVMPTIGKPLYDYFTYANLYQPCAALALGPPRRDSSSLEFLIPPALLRVAPASKRRVSSPALRSPTRRAMRWRGCTPTAGCPTATRFRRRTIASPPTRLR